MSMGVPSADRKGFCQNIRCLATVSQISGSIFELFPHYVRQVVVDDTGTPGVVQVRVYLRWWTLLLWLFGIRRRIFNKLRRMLDLGKPAGIVVALGVSWRK